ncbi:MAG: rhomboid family intramembrane serine protease [Aquihabitans sp.]
METVIQTCYRHPDQPAGVICQRCDRPICPRCMHQASVGFHCPECSKQGAQKVYRGANAMRTRPVLTQALIGVNVLVFVVGVIIGGSRAMGGSIDMIHIHFGLVAKLWEYGGNLYTGPVPGSIEVGVGGGQWYRMITSGFLHFGIIHLGMNMYALWILGNAVEQMGGRVRMATIYAVALLAGSFGALVLNPDDITAGASGAIFGLMGAIMLAQRAQGIPFRNSPLIWVLGLNLVFTLGIRGISVGGHVGGLLGGALAGWALFDLQRRPGVPAKLGYGICALAAIVCLVGGVVLSAGHVPA